MKGVAESNSLEQDWSVHTVPVVVADIRQVAEVVEVGG